VVPWRFARGWMTHLGYYKINHDTDYRALELAYMIFGHLTAEQLDQSYGFNAQDNSHADDGPGQAFDVFVKTAVAHAEVRLSFHLTWADARAALHAMVRSQSSCKVDRELPPATSDSDDDDDDYEPSDMAEDDEDPFYEGVVVEETWCENVDDFFTDVLNYDEHLDINFHGCHQESEYSVSHRQMFHGTESRCLRLQCDNPICCHCDCDCRLVRALYLCAENREGMLDVHHREDEVYERAVSERAHALIHGEFRRGVACSCAHALLLRRQVVAFESWRARGLAHPRQMAAELGLRVVEANDNAAKW
jgi:hypothetical protein